MLRNYFKIAVRSLLKQKVSSVINTLGLSTGIASCVLIVMFVANESSYDSFHTKADRIYRVVLDRKYPSYSINYAVIPYSFGDVIQRDFPEVESVVKMGGPYNTNGVSYQDEHGSEKIFDENSIMAADSNFFAVFSIKVLKGDPRKILLNPFDIVLTEETATRYFGEGDPIGRTLRIFDRDFVITGICQNAPENSHMKFDFLFKWDDQFLENGQSNFLGFSSHLYLQLRPGADTELLESKFTGMVETYAAAQMGSSWREYRKAGNDYRYFLQPLKTIHLDPRHIEGNMKPGGNINYVYFLACIAVVILIIACINFMNLATARSTERAREVGVRKTMGSLRRQLIFQFLLESLLITLCAMVIALGLVYSALPFFNELTGKSLHFIFTPWMAMSLTGLTLVVGLISGSYPAFVLSSFSPVIVMKGNFARHSTASSLRNSLVIFQFMFSIVLIASTLVVARQMHFIQNKPLGYEKDEIIVVERIFALGRDGAQTFIEEVKRLPEVEDAGGSFTLLGANRAGDYFGEQWVSAASSEILTTKSMVIDDEFASVLGFEFTEGRGFSKETNDSLNVILNETAVKEFQLTDPIGKKLTQTGPDRLQFTIVGVVKDFNFVSLHDAITPLTIRSAESYGGGAAYACAKIKTGSIQPALRNIESIWKRFAPGQPFKYLFLDENVEAQYKNEQRAGKIFGIFSGLAIVIACIGLFGLAAYTISQRTKEIGIRKVLGATIAQIVVLLSKDIARLVLISFILGSPLAWYFMDRWLQNFAYRINLGGGVFLMAGFCAIVISFSIVGYQSIRAARENPVRSLRNE
jgi:putative ABC transport system permease protein